jgi:hypothetical protein
LRAIGGDALLVPESPALGGFGYDIGGRLFNIDTLKFYEVLIGMQRGGALGALRAVERPVVCEIGAGWGGFAYQFKTLFPRATYVIVDFPELFLFSATYLKTVFPDATLRFVGTSAEVSLGGWRDADFVFVPNTLASVVTSLPLDLTVNMVSFQEMTDEQVRGTPGLAADRRVSAAVQPQSRALAIQRRARQRDRGAVGLVPAHRSHGAGTDYTTAMKKAPDGRRGVLAPSLDTAITSAGSIAI